jgi:hypothetical protein
MLNYVAYEFRLVSNIIIPGLVELTTLGANLLRTVNVSFGFLPPTLSHLVKLAVSELQPDFNINIDDRGIPGLRVWSIDTAKYFYLRYCDDTEFIIDNRGTQVWAAWPSDLTIEDTATYFLGPIMGFVMRLHGIACLHGSAVAIDGRVAIFIGDSGAGKSTTVAAFAQKGYSVLTDDVVALSTQGDTFLVQPAYPRIRLWESSVLSLFGKPDALPRIVPTHPTWDKRFLNLTEPGYHFSHVPLPLAAIYLLEPRQSESCCPRIIEDLSARERLLSLTVNTYARSFLPKSLQASEFDLLGNLVRSVPICQIVPHTEIDRLPKLIEIVLADFCLTAPN